MKTARGLAFRDSASPQDLILATRRRLWRPLCGALRGISPMHPGTHGDRGDDFPAVFAPGSAPSPNILAADSTERPGTTTTTTSQPPSRPPPSQRRTVWGTPAQAASFSSALHASSRHDGGNGWGDDGGMDDAWLELEEGFVLGSNNAKSVRAGRGLNTQQQTQRQRTQMQTQMHTQTGKPTSPASTAGIGGGDGAKTQPSSQGKEAEAQSAAQPDDNADAPKTAGTGGKKQAKKAKAKLVLTSGGRGAG